MTTNLTTKTAATYRISRGHESQVIEEAQRLYAEHCEGPCSGNCVASPASFRDAAERIVSLEEAVRSRDLVIVEAHDESALLRQDADGLFADSLYWENLSRVAEAQRDKLSIMLLSAGVSSELISRVLDETEEEVLHGTA